MKRNFHQNENSDDRDRGKFHLPESELVFSFSHSSGPGGENVNKLENKVMIHWDFKNSQALNEEEKRIIEQKLSHRINEKGMLFISDQSERFQHQNRVKAIEKLNQLISEVLFSAERYQKN